MLALDDGPRNPVALKNLGTIHGQEDQGGGAGDVALWIVP